MHAAAIVETFDPVDDSELGKRARVIAQPMRSLNLQRLEEALHRRVDAPMSKSSY